MAKTYQKRFYFSFKDVSNTAYVVEIWKLADIGTVSAVEIRGGASPFITNMPTLTNKFQPVRGTGCQINLISETNMQFLELYTANMFEFQIRAYIDADLIWTGYLDSELYSEPFDSLTNYPVSFSGTDGFALLDRLNYLDENGNQYSGIVSQFDILKIIFQKLNLPFTNYNIGLSTTIPGVTYGTQETIFHKSFIMNSDFYNEDNEPETLRRVLESILAPYGAFIMQRNGCIYITDIHSICTATTPFFGIDMKQYTTTSLIYSSINQLPVNIGDLSTIKFADSGQQLYMVSGINKQVVSYSPYKQVEIINYDAENDFTTAGTVTPRGATNFQWTETEYSTSNAWTNYNNGKFYKLRGIDGGNDNIIDYYLKINRTGLTGIGITSQTGATSGNLSYTYKGNLPILIPTKNYFLKIEMSVYFRTSNDLNNNNNIPDLIQAGELITRLKIGDRKYHSGFYSWDNGWVDLSDSRDLTLPFYTSSSRTKKSYIEDGYQALGKEKIVSTGTGTNDVIISKEPYLVPIFDFNGGLLEFNIYDYRVYNIDDFPTVEEKTVLDCRIKDIKFTIVDSNGIAVNKSDVEYVGYMNKQFKEEGSEITLLQGTNFNDYPIERGGLLKYDGAAYLYLKEHTRNNITDYIENLLLRSYVGNYENKTVELSATSNKLSSTLGFLTYNNYFNGKKFMVISNETNYAEKTTNFTIQEIFADSLTINKSF